MKTVIDLNEDALALAAAEFGTSTKKDTVNAALEFVAERRRRIESLLWLSRLRWRQRGSRPALPYRRAGAISSRTSTGFRWRC